MSNLKRSFFGAAIYLFAIFILGQADNSGTPIIDFASYFYLAVIVALPVTLFFPGISRAPWYVPVAVWAGVYLVVLQTVDRSHSAVAGEYSVIVLEFILLETGVWFAYQLALQLSHAESVMDALALGAFPNNVQDIEEEEKRIKIELTRSRRYRRPLSLVVIESESEKERITREMFRSIQHDLLNRFTFARIGQIIGNRARQTDIVLRDHKGRLIIVCPETPLENAILMANRIAQAVKERTDVDISWGAAAFPDEALTFDDLLHKARSRVTKYVLDASEKDNAVSTD